MCYLKGNILNSSAQALVNTVNTKGVMGKGVALQFKNAFQLNFKVYAEVCKKRELKPGKLLLVKDQINNSEKIIINFPTKTEWCLNSKYEYIEEGLKELVKVIEENKIKSIAIPALGCGCGNLEWDKVKLMIEGHLGFLNDVDIEIYEPIETVEEIRKS